MDWAQEMDKEVGDRFKAAGRKQNRRIRRKKQQSAIPEDRSTGAAAPKPSSLPEQTEPKLPTGGREGPSLPKESGNTGKVPSKRRFFQKKSENQLLIHEIRTLVVKFSQLLVIQNTILVQALENQRQVIPGINNIDPNVPLGRQSASFASSTPPLGPPISAPGSPVYWLGPEDSGLGED